MRMKWIRKIGGKEKNSAATRLSVAATGREKMQLHVIAAS